MIKKYYSILILGALLLFLPTIGFGDCTMGRELYQQAIKTSDIERRIELLSQSRQQCVEFSVLYELGRSFMKKGDLTRAEKWLSEAGSMQDANEVARSKALITLGNVYEQQGDLTRAITSYGQGLRLKEYPKVRTQIHQLEIKKSKMIQPKDEIIRALVQTKSFGIEAGVSLPVQFEYNKATLNKAGREQAAQLGEALMDGAFAESHFTLLGHTDSRGSKGYNLDLSKARAKAVKEFLVLNYPIEASRIAIKGYGETKPLYGGESEDIYRINRRVEVRVD